MDVDAVDDEEDCDHDEDDREDQEDLEPGRHRRAVVQDGPRGALGPVRLPEPLAVLLAGKVVEQLRAAFSLRAGISVGGRRGRAVVLLHAVDQLPVLLFARDRGAPVEDAHTAPGENVVRLAADALDVIDDAIAVAGARHTVILDALRALPLVAHALQPARVAVAALLPIGEAETLLALPNVADVPADAPLVAGALPILVGLLCAVPLLAEEALPADVASGPSHLGALTQGGAPVVLLKANALVVDALHAAVAGSAGGAGVAGVVLGAALLGLRVADGEAGAVVGGEAVGILRAVNTVVVGGASTVYAVKRHLAALHSGLVAEAWPVVDEIAVACRPGTGAGE